MRGGRAKVHRLEAIVVGTVDQDRSLLPGPALSGGIDDGEGVEEGVHDIDDQQKKGRRCEQRENDGPEAPPGTRAIDRRGLDQRLGYALQTRQEEQEVVRNLLPDGSQHNQGHCMLPVQQGIPLQAHRAQPERDDADAGGQHEQP